MPTWAVEFLRISWLVLKNFPIILKVLPVVAEGIEKILCAISGDCQAIAASPEIALSIRKGQLEHFHKAIDSARKGEFGPIVGVLRRHRIVP